MKSCNGGMAISCVTLVLNSLCLISCDLAQCYSMRAISLSLVLTYIMVKALISSLGNLDKLSKSLAHNSFNLEMSFSVSSFYNKTKFLIIKGPFNSLITSKTLKKTLLLLSSNKLQASTISCRISIQDIYPTLI